MGPLEKEVPHSRPTVVMIGNLHPVKGHFDLVEAIALLKPQFPDLLVLCAGEGPMRPVIEQQIAHHGLRETMLLLGHRLDVPPLLSRAQVAVLPSHAEGMSNALIEAMAASLPVVATAVGGNVELVVEASSGASGHLVPPHKPAQLAERLAGLLRDPQRCRALGAAGRKRVEAELTLEAMTRRIGELYRALLQSPAQRQAA
jgi:glycosyltransferase involved in cell wall biosynthesis